MLSSGILFINAKFQLSLLQPPTVVGDHLIFGWTGKDWAYAEAPPGTVFSVNARTGKREWTFDAIPADICKQTGTANVWTQMSADVAHGLIYLPVPSPSPNYWGGNRKDAIPLGTSTTALDVNTGNFAATNGLAVRVLYADICRLLNHS
ncbi:hypothetical protein QMZ30_11900 [Pantoea sp. EA-12]|uniref:hypothetical protein n=1 Tax=Pantoea sp. EA-12 TaxID=3043303 RepID=UPI0024B48469|nr:hypothetical protein [Pantoea sp. EA-12]MDI9221602.1 hypothetical protein [Pantoea sp. EA-12]